VCVCVYTCVHVGKGIKFR